jgi:LAO/AO transport system ATPase
MLDTLLDRFRQGDRRALAQLLSLVARGEQVAEILDRLSPPAKPTRVTAFTGAAGVGKSTLIGRIIDYLRKRNTTVAVLACDPQSPLSGGALLGDRVRMPSAPDEGLFIRSLAAAPGRGALAANLDAMLRLLESFGFENVLIETVGAGQGDTDVRDLADVLVLLLQPESGDDIQGEKAGLLEVADVVAIHKADLPGAEQAESSVRTGLHLSPHTSHVPVLPVSGRTGQGIEALWAAIAACSLRRNSPTSDGRVLLRLLHEDLTKRFAAAEAARDPAWSELLAQWRAGKLGSKQALKNVWKYLERD